MQNFPCTLVNYGLSCCKCLNANVLACLTKDFHHGHVYEQLSFVPVQ